MAKLTDRTPVTSLNDADLVHVVQDVSTTPVSKKMTIAQLKAAFVTTSLSEQSSDPANPAEGKSVIWQSDGTGAGDDGDIMIKITAGSVTKSVTLVDFSAS